MPKRRLVWIIAVCILLIAAIVYGLNKPPSSASISNTTKAAARPTTPSIELLAGDVVPVVKTDLRQSLSLSGSLSAVNQATIKSRVAGEVREVLVREGESVSEGQIVAKMDSTEYVSKAAQARGALVAAQGQRTITIKSRDANQALLAKGFISKNAFDNTASQYDIAQANVDSARAALEVTQKLLGDTTIRTPIAGLVNNRTVQPGEKVPADFHLLDVVNLKKMEMEIAVPTNQIQQVKLGQEAVLTIEGLSPPIIGSVARINPSTQSGSRSILVYIDVPNPQSTLRVGMFGLARLTLARRNAVLTVPAAAIQKNNNDTYVYTIENGILHQRAVLLGITGESIGTVNGEGAADTADRSAIEIVSGLIEGAQVVRYNLGNLVAGSQVTYSGKTPVPTPTR